ncbi:MAG: hypothetical protein Q7K43_06070 [Candidatus Woesearchaeota archaeon]|nr:hypothetical protein [Candidatus Woesearchaeota archaeon]
MSFSNKEFVYTELSSLDKKLLHLLQEQQQGSKAEALARGWTNFVPADAITLATLVTHAIAQHHIPQPSARVLDLGSGDGVSAMIFAMKGYESFGIETAPWLVERAETLKSRLSKAEYSCKLPQFACGTYLPKKVRTILKKIGCSDRKLILDDTRDGFRLLGVAPKRVDLFYVFPWTGQGESLAWFMNFCAKPGSKLFSYAYPLSAAVSDLELIFHEEVFLTTHEKNTVRGQYFVYEKK